VSGEIAPLTERRLRSPFEAPARALINKRAAVLSCLEGGIK
jgi:hypothetical protein